MKTKVLLLAAICSLLVYSCSTDREEEIKENPIEKMKVEKLELKKLKTNKNSSSQTNRTNSDSAGVSNPIASPANGIGEGIEPTDPNPDINPDDPEIIPPGDIRPPKK